MCTGIIQNSVADIIMKGRINFTTDSSLTLSDERLDLLYNNYNDIDYLKPYRKTRFG